MVPQLKYPFSPEKGVERLTVSRYPHTGFYADGADVRDMIAARDGGSR